MYASVVTVHPTPIAPYTPASARAGTSMSTSTSATTVAPADTAGIHPKSAAKRTFATVKRKRSDADSSAVAAASLDDDEHEHEDEDSGDAEPAGGKHRDGPRKKKANRACFHCQKSHLTCDDSRPCLRCVKRGMADNCTEGHRKKAKYLLDEEELEELKKVKTTKGAGSASPPPVALPPSVLAPPPPPQTIQAPPPPVTVPLPTSEPFPANDPLFNLSFDPTLPFGSEAANLEYSILSAILGDAADRALDDGGVLSSDALADALADPLGLRGGGAGLDSRVSPEPYAVGLVDGLGGAGRLAGLGGLGILEGSPEPYMQGLHDAVFSPLDPLPPALAGGADDDDAAGARALAGALAGAAALRTGPYSRAESPQLGITPSEMTLGGSSSSSGSTSRRHYQPSLGSRGGEGSSALTISSSAPPPRAADMFFPEQPPVHPGLLTPPLSQPSTSPRVTEASAAASSSSAVAPRKQSIYEAITTRYDYTEGYHALMKHLPARFEKNDILRIVRALAIVRPSLIALQMPLSDEDEVFVEKCFQRTLLEYEKLISFSGTPTVAWRRTGEICLVGAEFALLTDWTREELTGGRKYIWELFENSSVVEYWENFAAHAFENTTQSVYSHCVLLKPSGCPVPCTFCFSIRRDIFDLPSLVIGQWLPLL